MPQIFILSDNCYPTEQLYLKAITNELSERKNYFFEWIRCKKITPEIFFNSLHTKNIFIVFRTLPDKWISALEENRKKTKKIIYVLDDDLKAAVTTPQLPKKYRDRLSDFADNGMNNLLNLSDSLVVCSKHLESIYNDYSPKRLNPTFHFTDKHLRKPLKKSSTTSIFYHATSSHKNDLIHIKSPLLNILNENDILFESLIGPTTPSELKQHKRCKVRTTKSWKAFRLFQYMGYRKIGLAPLLDTPYNRGKSHVKLLDISAVGAVGIYSKRDIYNQIIDHGIDGFLANDDTDEWKEYMNYLIKNPKVGEKMAIKAQRKAIRISHPKHAYKFWNKEFSQA